MSRLPTHTVDATIPELRVEARLRELDLRLKAIESGVAQPQCFLRKTSTTPLPNNTATDVPFETEDYDPLGMHTGTSPNIVVPAAGLYMVVGMVIVSTPSSGVNWSLIVQIEVNGTVTWSTELSPVVSGTVGQPIVQTCAPLRCAAGDTINLAAFTNGGAATLSTGSLFAVFRQGPL